jgi:hypothetical protein
VVDEAATSERRGTSIVMRTVVATALAVLAMFAFTAVGSGAPPTDEIIGSCAIDGASVVSGFKGNPDRVDFFWTTAGGFSSSVADYEVGGKFGSVSTQTTPVRGPDEEPWVLLTFSVVYKETIEYRDTVPCLTGS